MTPAAKQLAIAKREAKARERELAPKKNKFNAKRTQSSDGLWFDSAKECRRYEELRKREQDGEISHLECQPKFKLAVGDRPVVYPNGKQARFTADFAYFDGRHRVVEDVKSKATRTEAYKLRRALVEAMFPAVRIVEV